MSIQVQIIISMYGGGQERGRYKSKFLQPSVKMEAYRDREQNKITNIWNM